jgi:hypothetical protein
MTSLLLKKMNGFSLKSNSRRDIKSYRILRQLSRNGNDLAIDENAHPISPKGLVCLDLAGFIW